MRKVTKVTKKIEELKTLGKRVEYLRTNIGLTQDELAKKVYVGRELVVKIENDTRSPKVETLKLLAQELNTTTDFLLCLAMSPSNDIGDRAIQERTGLSPEAVEVLVKYAKDSNNFFHGRAARELQKALNVIIENERTVHLLKHYHDYLLGDFAFTGCVDENPPKKIDKTFPTTWIAARSTAIEISSEDLNRFFWKSIEESSVELRKIIKSAKAEKEAK